MDAPRFVPLLPTHGVSPSLSGIRKASIAQPDRLLRPTLFDCPRKALSGLRPAAWPAVSFAAKRIFQSMLSGSRALDPVVLSGVIAVLLPSRFWPASLPHGRLICHLAVVLECIPSHRTHRRSFRAYRLRYCSSLTLSNHVTTLPLSSSVTAICVIEFVAVAPCQCFAPGGIQTTSPFRISSMGPPHC